MVEREIIIESKRLIWVCNQNICQIYNNNNVMYVLCLKIKNKLFSQYIVNCYSYTMIFNKCYCTNYGKFVKQMS